MDAEELIWRFPYLYHMAKAGSWPSIERHGLLSTTALLDLFEVPLGPARVALEAARRPESVTIEHPVHGEAVIRDNKPISDLKLAACLHGMDIPSFYRMLNGRVFFWLTERRLDTLLSARAYRDHAHMVLTVDTAGLIATQGAAVTLSPINSGSTAYNAMPRGPETFQTVADYNFEARCQTRTASQAIAELAVHHSVPNIVALVVRVETRQAGRESDILWEAGRPK